MILLDPPSRESSIHEKHMTGAMPERNSIGMSVASYYYRQKGNSIAENQKFRLG